MELVALTAEMLGEAASLFAARHQRLRRSEPALPREYEAEDGARAAIKSAFGRERSVGVAAVDGGRLHTYLISNTVIDEMWGRSGWVRAGSSTF